MWTTGVQGFNMSQSSHRTKDIQSFLFGLHEFGDDTTMDEQGLRISTANPSHDGKMTIWQIQ